MKDKLKNFFNHKRNIIFISIVLLIIMAVVTIYLLIGTKQEKIDEISFNEIEDIQPDDVQLLYKNMTDVSCYGSWYLGNDVIVDSGVVNITELSNNLILDYLFSYLDKSDLLTDSLNIDVVEEAVKYLYADNINIKKMIDNYSYNGYVYNIRNNEIVRQLSTCTSDIKYVSQLYGYSYNSDTLSMDINIGYMKNGTLYGLDGSNYGKYDGNTENLGDLLNKSSYYRYNFVLNDDKYKLISVELKNKIS